MKLYKKILLSIFGITLVSMGLCYWLLTNSVYNGNGFCAFCDPTIIANQTFYEDNLVRGLFSYQPVQPWHCLVVPKRHIERFEEISDAELLATGKALKCINIAIKKLQGPSSYLVLQKNGADVGQTVPHVHVHYIPKPARARTAPAPGLFSDFALALLRPKLSKEKLAEMASRMRSVMASQESLALAT